MLRSVTLVLLMSACVGPESAPEALIGAPHAEPVPLPPVELAPLAAPALVAVPCRPIASVAFTPLGARRLADVENVRVGVVLPRQCAPERVTIELIAPRGQVFEVRHADVHGAASVSFRFPVAGAAIALRGLSGPWQVRAFADGVAVSPQSFELDR